ncbi:MAG: hypothetical protein GX130_02330 [Candidatus Hydrogenedens sp.]|jgi:hypothetical protein|nr:hypothetical protein [Candidatus Hydrogenedens sp.]
MKKVLLVILIVLGVLLIAIIAGGAIAWNKFDGELGLSASPVLQHQTVCDPGARLRLIANPLLLVPYLVDYLPEKLDLPLNADQIKTLLPHVLPRELAVLIKTDMNTHKAQLTVFANEQRLGRLFAKELNGQNLLAKVKQINWTSDGFELPERGNLFVQGTLAIPEAVEEELFELWPVQSKAAPAAIEGNHHLELVLDNNNGDLLALIAAGVSSGGQDWEAFRKSQEAEMAMGVVQTIQTARLAADLNDPNTATFILRIEADETGGPGLQFLLSGLALPWVTQYLKNEMDLTLSGDLQWNEAEKAILGSYTLTGLEAVIRQKMAL